MKEHIQTQRRTSLTRVFSIIMALFMTIMIMPDVKPLKTHAAEYNIWILGKKVTDSNKSNILGNSTGVKFNFDYNTNTLHVVASGSDTTIYTKDGRYWTSSAPYSNIIYSTYPNLKISIDSNVSFIDNKGVVPISYNNSNYTLLLKGSGQLTVNTKANTTYSNFISGYKVRIENAKLVLSCRDILYCPYQGAAQLTIYNSSIKANYVYNLSESSNSSYTPSATMSSCYFSSPDDAYIYTGSKTYRDVRYGSGSFTSSFTITPGTKPPTVVNYGLKIRDTQVTSANKDDITGSGQISYNPDTKTLTIKKDITATAASIIENTGVEGLKITASAPVTLWGMSSDPAIYTTKSIEFTGSNRITIATNTTGMRVKSIGSSNPSIVISSPFTIDGGVFGIDGENGQSLKLNNSGIWIIDCSSAAVLGFAKKITLGSSVVLDVPQPYILTDPAGAIRDKNGDIAKEVKTAANKSYGITVGTTTINTGNYRDVFGDGKVSYDPDEKKLYIKGTYSGIKTSVSNVTVVLTGDTTITNSSGTANIALGPYGGITGSGKLTCDILNGGTNSVVIDGIDVTCKGDMYSNTSSITIKNGKVSVAGSMRTSSGYFVFDNTELNVSGDVYTALDNSAIAGTYGKITINRSNVKIGGDLKTVYGNINISGGTNAKIKGSVYSEKSKVNVTGSVITVPENGKIGSASSTINSGIIYNNSSVLANEITIAQTSYGLKYGNMPVDSTWDLNNIDGNRKISYNPSTKTLTLKGTPTTGSDHSIRSTVEGLTIKVQSDSDLTTVYGYVYTDIQLTGNTVITGPGKLSVSRLSCTKNLTIRDANIKVDHPTLNTTTSEYIRATDNLTIINSEIFTGGGISTQYGNIRLDGCHIAAPAQASIQPYGSGKRIAVGYADAKGIHISKGYGFKICGTEVTAASDLSNLGPNGEMSYDPANNTLTLNNDVPIVGKVIIENVSNVGLIINGNGHMIRERSNSVILHSDTTITGKISVYGLLLCDEAIVNIKDADMECATILGNSESDNAKLNVINSNVAAFNKMYIYGEISLDNSFVKSPGLNQDFEIIDGVCCLRNANDKPYTGYVEIIRGKYVDYGFNINGKRVNTCYDLANLGPNGEFSYDPDTNTLTLIKDYEYDGTYPIQNISNNGLIINGNGHSIISKRSIELKADTKITGKLTLGDESLPDSKKPIMGMVANIQGSVTINIEDADLYIAARGYGMGATAGDKKLVIRNSNVEVVSTAGITGFDSGISLERCKIVIPENYVLEDNASNINESLIRIAPTEFAAPDENAEISLGGDEEYTYIFNSDAITVSKFDISSDNALNIEVCKYNGSILKKKETYSDLNEASSRMALEPGERAEIRISLADPSGTASIVLKRYTREVTEFYHNANFPCSDLNGGDNWYRYYINNMGIYSLYSEGYGGCRIMDGYMFDEDLNLLGSGSLMNKEVLHEFDTPGYVYINVHAVVDHPSENGEYGFSFFNGIFHDENR
ncbi:hypothetical protein [Ruminococcus flavefaciens]|uniref:hypothetical protein n=1 Tax=Ruminococcus flavefaciens TaxID=1265 RepID=UPI00035F7648|nr:hypothetical protein [Ruminococcus flavefaciens]